MKSLKIFNVCVVLCVALCVFFTGCKTYTEDEVGDNTSSTESSSNKTYDVSLNVYDAVLAAQAKAGRSILPDVKSNEIFFTVVATNNAGAWDTGNSKQADDGTATDTVYAPITTKGETSITINLKAANYWRIKVYGTTETGALSGNETESEAITRVSGAAIITGNISFYLGLSGVCYKIDSTLVQSSGAVSAGNTYGALKVTTSPNTSSGTGSISLPIKTEASSGILYYAATYSVISGGAEHEATTTTLATATDGITTLSASGLTPGLYKVDITLATASGAVKELYSWPETLTVWGGVTSTWSNSVANNYTAAISGNSLGLTEGTLYLDVTATKVTNYKRTTFYVSSTSNNGTSGHLIAGSDSTGNGSIFKPYATVAKAITQTSADGTDWQIVVDGTTAETTQIKSIGGTDTTICGYVTSAATNTSETTDDMIITVRKFAGFTANVSYLSGTYPVLYVEGGNTTFTLQNVTVTGPVTVATDGFILDKSTIAGVVTLKSNGNCLTVDLDDTTSSVTSITPGFTASDNNYNALIIKAKDDDFTSDWLTTMANKLALTDTWSSATGNTGSVLAIDTDSSSTTKGSVIIKKASEITVDNSSWNGYTIAMTSAVSTVAVNTAGTGTDITDTITLTITDGSSNSVTTGVSNVSALLYDNSGTSYTCNANNTTTNTIIVATLPGVIKANGATYTLQVSFQFNGNVYCGNFTVTVQ